MCTGTIGWCACDGLIPEVLWVIVNRFVFHLENLTALTLCLRWDCTSHPSTRVSLSLLINVCSQRYYESLVQLPRRDPGALLEPRSSQGLSQLAQHGSHLASRSPFTPWLLDASWLDLLEVTYNMSLRFLTCHPFRALLHDHNPTFFHLILKNRNPNTSWKRVLYEL